MAPCPDQAGARLARAEGCRPDSAVTGPRWAARLAWAAALREDLRRSETLIGSMPSGTLPEEKPQAACHAGASCHCAKAHWHAGSLMRSALEQVLQPALCCLMGYERH